MNFSVRIKVGRFDYFLDGESLVRGKVKLAFLSMLQLFCVLDHLIDVELPDKVSGDNHNFFESLVELLLVHRSQSESTM